MRVLYKNSITLTLDEIEINGHRHIRYHGAEIAPEETANRSQQLLETLSSRRSIREFSDRPVPKSVIESLIMTGSTAPSGANKQPWTFCAVSNADMKHKIKEAAEAEERESYGGRMSDTWIHDLKPFGTNAHKPFLKIAPWLIIVFKRAYEFGPDDEKQNNYYVGESVGIACGMLISAIHQAGLVTLTHTPSPMNFLAKILERPKNERAFLLLPVGYPADKVYVPDIKKKAPSEVIEWFE